MTEIQKSVFEKVQALREHSRETGMVTTRAQNKLLSSLSDDDLAVVVLALRKSMVASK